MRHCQVPEIADPSSPIYENAVIVLASPKFSGNIGSTARVMKNLGFRHLRIVDPRCELLNDDARMMSLDAVDLIEQAEVFKSLPKALSDCRLVAGTTRRHGVMRRNLIEPSQFASLAESVLKVGKLGVVFGAEDRGLSNEEIAHCAWIVTIPSPSEYDSFNLSHAVGIMCYALSCLNFDTRPRENLASSKNLESMFDHVELMLREVGFIKEKDPARMMLVVRQMMHRAALDEREVRVIRGILRQTDWKIQNPKKKSTKKRR